MPRAQSCEQRGSPDAGSTSSSPSRQEELPSALALLTGTSLAARTKMRSLDLEASRIEALPFMLSSFGNLEWLNLSDNRLRTLPDWIATHLCCLREVDLSRNRFTDAAEVLKLGGLPSLRSLDLRHNPLSEETKRPFLVQALLQPRRGVEASGVTEASRRAELLVDRSAAAARRPSSAATLYRGQALAPSSSVGSLRPSSASQLRRSASQLASSAAQPRGAAPTSQLTSSTSQLSSAGGSLVLHRHKGNSCWPSLSAGTAAAHSPPSERHPPPRPATAPPPTSSARRAFRSLRVLSGLSLTGGDDEAAVEGYEDDALLRRTRVVAAARPRDGAEEAWSAAAELEPWRRRLLEAKARQVRGACWRGGMRLYLL